MSIESRINEIEYHLTAATQGPWICEGFADGDHVRLSIYETHQGREIATGITRQADAALLLNAPGYIAFLLTELKKARI